MRTGTTNNEKGYTLFEMMVTVAVISLLSLGLPAIAQSVIPRLALRSAVETVTSELLALREEAVRSGQETGMVQGNNPFSLILSPGQETKNLDDAVTIAIEPDPETPVQGRGSFVLRFYPTGRSSGGLVHIMRGKAKATLQVDWLTGAIKEKADG